MSESLREQIPWRMITKPALHRMKANLPANLSDKVNGYIDPVIVWWIYESSAQVRLVMPCGGFSERFARAMMARMAAGKEHGPHGLKDRLYRRCGPQTAITFTGGAQVQSMPRPPFPRKQRSSDPVGCLVWREQSRGNRSLPSVKHQQQKGHSRLSHEVRPKYVRENQPEVLPVFALPPGSFLLFHLALFVPRYGSLQSLPGDSSSARRGLAD
jgi:hypothetical protein